VYSYVDIKNKFKITKSSIGQEDIIRILLTISKPILGRRYIRVLIRKRRELRTSQSQLK